MAYQDNGPICQLRVFQSVMGSFGIRVLTHMPPSEAERRSPARAKGKNEPAQIVQFGPHGEYHRWQTAPLQAKASFFSRIGQESSSSFWRALVRVERHNMANRFSGLVRHNHLASETTLDTDQH